MKRFGIVAFAIALLCAGAASAADLPLPPPKPIPNAQPQRILPAPEPNEFDRLGSDCIEAWNGCQRFKRADDGKFDAINNTGIACQPQPLSCSARR
ncbi:MAG TPA: hypothetical protein PL193_14500 [Xanthobacteraceae bacterium]|nr:hypothetical protein [Xanthobacteraceae bacterium]